jgi:hypothetical protein
MLLFAGQLLAWFQSNSGILAESEPNKAILIAAIAAPLTTLSFAFGTKFLYEEVESLWSIHFIGFSIGYFVFIPLTWYFLGEEILTAKNIISILLCVTLLLVRAFMD